MAYITANGIYSFEGFIGSILFLYFIPWVPYLSLYCYFFPFLLLTNHSFSIFPFHVWWSFPIFSDVGLFISSFPVFPPAHVFYEGLTKGFTTQGAYSSLFSLFIFAYSLFFVYFSPSDHCLWLLATPCNDFFLTHNETFEVVCEEVNSFFLKE